MRDEEENKRIGKIETDLGTIQKIPCPLSLSLSIGDISQDQENPSQKKKKKNIHHLSSQPTSLLPPPPSEY